MSQLNLDRNQHRLRIRLLQRGKNLTKNTSKLLTVFLHSRAIGAMGGGVILIQARNVVMSWRLLVHSRAMVWQSDPCLRIGSGITQKQIPSTTIWQRAGRKRAIKICRHRKLKHHGNKRLYQHKHVIPLWINKRWNVNLFRMIQYHI